MAVFIIASTWDFFITSQPGDVIGTTTLVEMFNLCFFSGFTYTFADSLSGLICILGVNVIKIVFIVAQAQTNQALLAIIYLIPVLCSFLLVWEIILPGDRLRRIG